MKTQDNGSSWSATAVTKFVWDGWLLVAELDGLDSDPVSRSRGAATGAWAALDRTYTWGLDLSGTLQGAGGIGGLLMVDDTAEGGFCRFYPVIPPQRRETGLRAYDGNGNACQVIDAEDGSLAAHDPVIPLGARETGLRDPVGREIVATGDYADDNPWRFSTKHLDPLDADDPDAGLLIPIGVGVQVLIPLRNPTDGTEAVPPTPSGRRFGRMRELRIAFPVRDEGLFSGIKF